MIEASPAPDGFDARRDARLADLLLLGAGVARAKPVRDLQGALVAAPGRSRRHWTLRRGAGRRHDFTAFTPTQTEQSRFERDVAPAPSGGRIGSRSRFRASCWSSGSRPTRSCATWSGCWSGRCSRWPAVGGRSRTSGPCSGRAARARRRDRARARPLPRLGAATRAWSLSLRQLLLAEARGAAAGGRSRSPVAKSTGLPSALVTVARVIASVRPGWTTSARAVSRRRLAAPGAGS